jgi:hypothetical protein
VTVSGADLKPVKGAEPGPEPVIASCRLESSSQPQDAPEPTQTDRITPIIAPTPAVDLCRSLGFLCIWPQKPSVQAHAGERSAGPAPGNG